MRHLYSIDTVTLNGVALTDVTSVSVWVKTPSRTVIGKLVRSSGSEIALTGDWNWQPSATPPRLVLSKNGLEVTFCKGSL